MSSGSYFPPPVKAVAIPKKSGGQRILGIPTVSDRIAQMAVKFTLEPEVEPCFLNDSYGYRPNKSALDAIDVTRQRCWTYNWVLEYDIKGLFDNISHGLLMKAVKQHTSNKWVILYVERWLKAPIAMPDGTSKARTKGTPQGGVISPILSNLFLHYAFDMWISSKYPQLPWCRYADDGLVHCRTLIEAERLLEDLKQRLAECELELHSDKTRIICCKVRNKSYRIKVFDFLGYTFKPRLVCNRKEDKLFIGFVPAVSKAAIRTMQQIIKSYKWHLRSELSLANISQVFDPILTGWINYYGRHTPQALVPMEKHFNNVLVKWAMRKYSRLKGRKIKAMDYIENIAKSNPNLFVHWRQSKGFAVI